jgi:hypothetical protein
MIRFTYREEADPKKLHREFLRAGAIPSMYSYYHGSGEWRLSVLGIEEADIIREVLEGFGVEFEEKEVANRFIE